MWWKCHNCGYEWETTPEKSATTKKLSEVQDK
ncbi:MAG: hypothetical protein ACLTJ5_01985 [Clostridium sp.]